jgi:hypothetical protein
MIPETLRRNAAFSIALRGSLGVIGFILSPLSWWNDLFVNVPLSFAFAWGVGRFLALFTEIHQWLFLNLFVVGYFLTNLIGFLMMHYSIFGLKGGKAGSLKTQALISLIYTAVILAFFSLNICNPEGDCKVFPSWVKP